MGRAALARRAPRAEESAVARTMTELLRQITTLIDARRRAISTTIERTLTDGYAQALSLEAERWRLEQRIDEVAPGLARGDTAEKARELAALARRIDGNAATSRSSAAALAELRRHADAPRAARQTSSARRSRSGRRRPPPGSGSRSAASSGCSRCGS